MFKRIRWWWLKKAGRGASTFVKCILTFFSSLEKFAKNMAFIVFYGIVLVILYIVIVENYKLNFRKMVENIKHLQFEETKMPVEPSANPQKASGVDEKDFSGMINNRQKTESNSDN